jgi:hypothetical protein
MGSNAESLKQFCTENGDWVENVEVNKSELIVSLPQQVPGNRPTPALKRFGLPLSRRSIGKSQRQKTTWRTSDGLKMGNGMDVFSRISPLKTIRWGAPEIAKLTYNLVNYNYWGVHLLGNMTGKLKLVAQGSLHSSLDRTFEKCETMGCWLLRSTWNTVGRRTSDIPW